MNRAGKQVETQKEEVKKVSGKNTSEINDTLKRLLSGEDLFDTIDTVRGQFTLKFPRPRVLRQIQVLLSQRFADADLSKMAPATLRFYEIYATLDVIIVKAPQWWDDLDSSEDCPDDKLIGELYRRYLRFYNRIQSEIGGIGTESGTKPAKGTSDAKETPLVDGAFSGIAHDEGISGFNG
jgi:hypothetical protein